MRVAYLIKTVTPKTAQKQSETSGYSKYGTFMSKIDFVRNKGAHIFETHNYFAKVSWARNVCNTDCDFDIYLEKKPNV